MPGNSEIDEREVVRAFFSHPKRKRLLTMLDSPRPRRGDLIQELWHGESLDHRWRIDIPADQQTVSAIHDRLTIEGAEKRCWVISAENAIDERWMELREALDYVVGNGSGTLLICRQYTLAYYEGEAPSDRAVLNRSL